MCLESFEELDKKVEGERFLTIAYFSNEIEAGPIAYKFSIYQFSGIFATSKSLF